MLPSSTYRRSRALIFVAVLAAMVGALGGRAARAASSFTVNSGADSGPGTLRQAIMDANAAGGGTITFSVSDIGLASRLPNITSTLAIQGPGAASLNISGQDQVGVFFVQSGTVTISDLTVSHGKATGGHGGAAAGGGGGGGAGMGGGLVVNGGTVTLDGVVFSANQAIGGVGGTGFGSGFFDGGGGGGVGGNGANGSTTANAGGNGGGGGPFGGTGGAGAPSSSTAGGNGGDGAGGGGGANSTLLGGGAGGFGGGGGGGGAARGGNGGFGGGGGAGGFNAPAGSGGSFGGNAGSGDFTGNGGGGGAGLGGAVFVRAGAVGMHNVNFTANAAARGAGGTGATSGQNGADGQGKGGALFVNSGATVIQSGGVTFSANTATDAAGSGTDTADVYGSVGVLSVTGLSVASGPSAGGTVLAVTGTGFDPAPSRTSVSFGGTPASSVACSSSTQCFVVSPPGTGTVDVTAAVYGVATSTTPADHFSYVSPPPPAVTGLSPATGPADGGTAVTITGTSFDTAPGATAVSFGASPATGVSCVSATSCTATSPAGSGAVDVTVTVGGQTSTTGAASRYTYTTATPAPTNLRVSGAITGAAIPLAWNDNSTDETSFQLAVLWNSPGATWQYQTAPANATTATVGSLLPGNRYYIYVRACNAGGCSPWSNVSGGTTPGSAPSAPASFHVTAAGYTGIDTAWTNTATNAAMVQFGSVISTSTIFAWTALPPSATAYTHAPVVPGGVYFLYAHACNAVGCSANVSLGVHAGGPPTTPTWAGGLTVNGSGDSASVTWNDVTGETTYQLGYATAGIPLITWSTPAADSTSATIGGLAQGATYYAFLRACNPSGCSAYAPTLTIRMAGGPPGPRPADGRAPTDDTPPAAPADAPLPAGVTAPLAAAPGVVGGAAAPGRGSRAVADVSGLLVDPATGPRPDLAASVPAELSADALPPPPPDDAPLPAGATVTGRGRGTGGVSPSTPTPTAVPLPRGR